MLIEYKIKFEKNGVTITQRVEPGPSGVITHGPKAAATPTPSVNGQAASAQLDDHYVAPAAAVAQAAGAAKPAAKGGGDTLPTDTGEGNTHGIGAGSGLTIMFGPTVIGGSALGPIGGGDTLPTDTGEGKAQKSS
jgi:hypothetical protein